MPDFTLQQQGTLWRGTFRAMASPCEVLIETDERKLAARITRLVCQEAKRIEQKWSRYQRGNIIYRINTANGEAVQVDDETAELLNLAQTLWQLSEGKFDITSGVLRKAWRFDGSDSVPSQADVDAIRPLIGWNKIHWQAPLLTLKPDMELDFGGIGKEYAADRCLSIATANIDAPVLINLGGDLVCNKPQAHNQPWKVGIEGEATKEQVLIYKGALATSGDAYRYLEKNGLRYSHVLDATTGWPVPNAPKSVTVAAESCSQAGILSSLALLQGTEAKEFLLAQGVKFYLR